MFGHSAAGSLRAALAELGLSDEVAGFFDDLGFGPIDPSDLSQRARWVEAELGWSDWDELDGDIRAFWATVQSDQHRLVAWLSRRSTREHAGFLEFVSRLGNLSCDVIDLTDVLIFDRKKNGEATKPAPALSVGSLSVGQIVENNLLSHACALTAQTRDDYLAIWRTLQQENAALRVLSPNLDLQSAPITFFDERTISFVRADWSKAALVVGETLCSFWDDALWQVEDLVLIARLFALVDAGVIEGRGDLTQLKGSEVRLLAPQKPTSS